MMMLQSAASAMFVVLIVLAVTAIIATVTGHRKVAQYATGICIAILTVFAAVWMNDYAYRHRPASVIAADFVRLPPEAAIISATAGDYGDGTVTFTLPTTKSVYDWIRSIWKTNDVTKGVDTGKGSYDWSGFQESEDDFISLTYDSRAKTYTYNAMAN